MVNTGKYGHMCYSNLHSFPFEHAAPFFLAAQQIRVDKSQKAPSGPELGDLHIISVVHGKPTARVSKQTEPVVSKEQPKPTPQRLSNAVHGSFNFGKN